MSLIFVINSVKISVYLGILLLGRDKLTLEESQIISKNVIACFKAGTDATVVKKLGSAIIYWYLSKEECYFRSVNGATYINHG